MDLRQIQTPISIVLAGILVAGAIVLNGGLGNTSYNMDNSENHSFGNQNSNSANNVRAVSEEDHIFGDLDANVVIIEYSDFECPFCSRAHPTFEEVVNDYDGEVAWVYRHFPLTSIHSRAQKAAVASECVAELAGNEAFWNFISTLFENQRNLGDELYIDNATALGIEEDDFRKCLDSSKYDVKISEDIQNALDSGGRGTPFSIVVNGKGEAFPFVGALPYDQVKSIIEEALASS